ncbi:MAG: cell division protein FtsQ/DivIB [Rhodocyclaceae bacterium]|nr:cell division protein FtsQ/DivIB [Rhodocyclaceae bacterium]MDZ4215437.1 cell division protein FtsQ/DivIB [Rhodocyclaceae bacterium]
MAKAKAKGNVRLQDAEPSGLWHQPAFLNLFADLLLVLATAALAWAALTTLQRLPLFPLRELVLTEKPGLVSSAQLEHATRAAVSGNFFTVDLNAARSAYEKLPWVRKAVVSRQWPDGLKLTLEEHEARARWRPLGSSAVNEGLLVNQQGELFSADVPVDGKPDVKRLPQFSGPEGSAPELLQRHGEFTLALAPIQRQVEAITLSPRRAWRLELDNGVRIELGRDQERHPLTERLARFVEHYDYIAAHSGKQQTVDMRYPNGFAMNAAINSTLRPASQERKS